MPGIPTPSTLPASRGLCITIPDGPEWLAALRGAVRALCQRWAWVDIDGISVDDTVDAWEAIFDSLVEENDCEGRMHAIGEVFVWGGLYPPVDTLPCDGRSLAKADYPLLFAALGDIWGSADVNHFNIPDAQGRVIIGPGTGEGLSLRTVAGKYGEETHALTANENGQHSHLEYVQYATGGTKTAPAAVTQANTVGQCSAGVNTGNSGLGTAHNNIQPSVCMLVVIQVA